MLLAVLAGCRAAPPGNVTAFKDPVSLETSSTNDIDPLENFLSDDKPSPIEKICEEIIKDNATSIIDTLPPREAAILKLRFGLGEEGEKTLEEVGARFEVSRERVRQWRNTFGETVTFYRLHPETVSLLNGAPLGEKR